MPFEFSEQQVADYHKSTFDLLDYLQNVIDGRFFTEAQSILDVGCGDGKMAAFIAKNTPKAAVVGCDLSHSMIEFASKKYNSEEYPNLQFLEKDACHLGFHEEFDRAISFNCLHWVKSQKMVLTEIYSSLKSGGKAFFVAVPETSDDDLQTICRKIVFSFKWLPYFFSYRPDHSFHSQKEYEEMLKEIGFSVERIEERQRKAVFKNREELEVLLKSVLTPLYHLPEKKRGSFLNDFFAQLVKRGNVDASGEVHFYIGQIEMLVSKN